MTGYLKRFGDEVAEYYTNTSRDIMAALRPGLIYNEYPPFNAIAPDENTPNLGKLERTMFKGILFGGVGACAGIRAVVQIPKIAITFVKERSTKSKF